MLPQFDQEPPTPHDRLMVGRCMICNAVVECRYGDCKLVDDPPMGKVPAVACPCSVERVVGRPEKCNGTVRVSKKRGSR